MTRALPLIAVLLLGTLASAAGVAPGQAGSSMDNRQLETILRKVDPMLVGANGRFTLHAKGREVLVLTDEHADRMRFISAIGKIDSSDATMLARLLVANFESALDARYAVFDGTLWSAFIHPLSSLQPEEVPAAIDQVVTLVANTGTTFSSSNWIFGGGARTAPSPAKKPIQ